MTPTTILTYEDVQFLLTLSKNVSDEAKKAYAITLSKLLVESARSKNIRSRFANSIQNSVSTKFLLYQLNPTDTFRSINIDLESLLNEYTILNQVESYCGKYVQATYGLEDSRINIFLEFVPPNTIPNTDPPFSDPIWDRRLEKETSW